MLIVPVPFGNPYGREERASEGIAPPRNAVRFAQVTARLSLRFTWRMVATMPRSMLAQTICERLLTPNRALGFRTHAGRLIVPASTTYKQSAALQLARFNCLVQSDIL